MARRLVFLHGFTQTHHHWHTTAELIAAGLTPGDRRPDIVLPDLPGHGLSHADTADIDSAARELVHLIGPATYVGYSMGGRVALHAALSHGSNVERLVLIGATAGLADDDARVERRSADETRADHLERIGATAFLDEWLDLPLFATLPDDPMGRDRRRCNTAPGLAHSLRTAGTGAQRSLWPMLDRLDIPALLVVGELDVKFTEIAHRMADALPYGEVATIAGAGHAAHSERPDEVAGTICEWLAATG